MKKLFTAALVIVIVIMLWIVRLPLIDLFAWFGDREAVTGTVEQLGIWGPAVLFALFVLQVFFAFIPGQALMVACGYIYGFWVGLLISWFSLFAGGQAAFFLARRYGRPFAERWIAPHVLSKWDKAADGQGIGFYALSLVLPVFPNDAMCYVAGLGKISSRRFSIANLLGRGLACLFTSAAGAFGGQIPWQGWVLIAVITVLGALGWWIVKNRKANLSSYAKGGRHVKA
jgi:uncharacterized membrane protein YdjX (TVP38/TMEM64 family)